MKLTWLEISKSALQNNISQLKKNLSKKTKFMAVVKANAYGHGLLEVVNCVEEKVDYLAVYNFEDAIFLRKKKIKKPILVLGCVFQSQIELAIKNNIEITVSTFEVLEAIKKIRNKEKLAVHLCIDTGLGRDGFVISDIKKVLNFLKNSNLKPKGLYAHFSCADDSSFDSYTKKQIDELLVWKKSLSDIGLKPLTHHLASSGTFISNLKDFDLVRVGISLYGLWPSKELQNLHQNKIKLKPALSWKALISEVKFMPKGSAISYGCTHILKRDSKIAILPIGYYDGISRVSSNKGMALVNGIKVKQIGRVTMNIIVLDVTDVKKVKVGDVATIIGRDKKENVSADDWAGFAQTSNYEIVTRINAVLKREVVK